MKKKTLLKVFIGIIAVLLIFSLAACGGKDKDKKGKGKVTDNDTPSNSIKVEDLAQILGKVDVLLEGLYAVDDELHADLELALTLNDQTYSVFLKADIFANPAEYSQTKARVALAKAGYSAPLLDVMFDGSTDTVYLWTNLTTAEAGRANATGQKAKFSSVKNLEISKLLAGIPAAVKGIVTTKDNTALSVSGLLTMLEDLNFGSEGEAGMIDGILEQAQAITFEDTGSAYKLGLQTPKIGELVTGLSGFLGDIIAKNQELVDGVCNLLFGVPFAQIADAQTFPELEIVIGKNATTITGLTLNYKGNLDDNQNDQEELGIDVKINKLSATGAVDNINKFGNKFELISGNYAEAAAKVTLDLVADGKNLGIRVEAIANPLFGKAISGGGIENDEPVAYLRVLNTKVTPNTVIDNIDAKYVVEDGEGYLYFDFSGAYDFLGADAPENGAIYKLPFTFFAEEEPSDQPPQAAPEAPEAPAAPKFVATSDIVGFVLGKINTILNFVNGVVDNKQIGVDVPFILNVIDGLFYEPKLVDGNYVPGDKKFTAANWTALFEELLAPLSDLTGEAVTDAEKAQDIINKFTGFDVSVAQIFAGNDDSNLVSALIGIFKTGFGIDVAVSYKATAGAAAQSVISASVKIDFITDFDTLAEDDFSAYGKDYEGALDLTTEDNIYFYTEVDGEKIIVDEGAEGAVKGYKVLDDLMELLDAYRLREAA